MAADSSSSSASESPTVAALSGVGLLLGTAAYMSPEQDGAGRSTSAATSRRSGAWRQMLTGSRMFEGEDTADILANVLKSTTGLVAPACRHARLHPNAAAPLSRTRSSAAAAGHRQRTARVGRRHHGRRRASARAGPRPRRLGALGGGRRRRRGRDRRHGSWAPWRLAPRLPTTRMSIEPGADAPLVTEIATAGDPIARR